MYNANIEGREERQEEFFKTMEGEARKRIYRIDTRVLTGLLVNQTNRDPGRIMRSDLEDAVLKAYRGEQEDGLNGSRRLISMTGEPGEKTPNYVKRALEDSKHESAYEPGELTRSFTHWNGFLKEWDKDPHNLERIGTYLRCEEIPKWTAEDLAREFDREGYCARLVEPTIALGLHAEMNVTDLVRHFPAYIRRNTGSKEGIIRLENTLGKELAEYGLNKYASNQTK